MSSLAAVANPRLTVFCFDGSVYEIVERDPPAPIKSNTSELILRVYLLLSALAFTAALTAASRLPCSTLTSSWLSGVAQVAAPGERADSQREGAS